MADGKKVVFWKAAGERFSRFIREMRSELKKVVWPSRKQVFNNSVIVLISVAVVGSVTFAFDTVVGSAVRWLISIFKG